MGVALVRATWSLAAGALARQPTFNDEPPTETWFPPGWAPDDEAGAINKITPAVVMKAMKLVKQGETVTIGKLHASDIPACGARAFLLSIPGTPTGGPFGSSMLVYHDELVTTEIGQTATRFDGAGHIAVHTSKCDMLYNRRCANATSECGGGTQVVGVGDPGAEQVAIQTSLSRGMLLDRPKLRGVDPLPIPRDTKSPGILTADDVKAVVKNQGLEEIGEGDYVFLDKSRGDLWKNSRLTGLSTDEKAQRPATFTSGEPRFGRSACKYPASRKIAFMGGDTSANHAQPVGGDLGRGGARPLRDADAMRSLEDRKSRVRAAPRGMHLRVRARLGPARARGRYRLARRSGRGPVTLGDAAVNVRPALRSR